MVLGLGTRSKKDRASAVAQLVEFDLHLHEISPWSGLSKSSKELLCVVLRWSRGEKLIGSSKKLNPTAASPTEPAKIILGDSFRTLVAPTREVLKYAKKLHPDLESPLVFALYDVNDPKGKPLVHTALDLSSLVAITESKQIAVPFNITKKVSKGTVPYLNLTINKHHDDNVHAQSASASMNTSGRTSDASSVPPLDEDTQQRLVAALLSDEGGSNPIDEEIDSFTDDDGADDEKEINVSKIDHRSNLNHTGLDTNLPRQNENVKPADLSFGNTDQKIAVTLMAERQPKRSDERLSVYSKASPQDGSFFNAKADVAHPQASPVKAAAIAAAAAYQKKHSFLPRHSNAYMDDSDDSLSDFDGAGDDRFSSRFSKIESSSSTFPKAAQRTVASSQVVVETMTETVEKSGIKDSTHITASEDNLSISINKSSSGLGFPSESFLNPVTSFEKISSKEKSSSQTVEITENKSLMNSERDAVAKQQVRREKAPQNITITRSPDSVNGAQKISKSPDPMKARAKSSSPVQDLKTSKVVMQETRTKALKKSDQEIEKSNKKSNNENGQRSLNAEGKGAIAQSQIQQLEAELENLKGELRDVAAVEAALYSTTSEHGGSSMKLHAPARRLARVYLYACKHWTDERRASCARNIMSGLVIVARACGNDVARLTFWWSNTVVLREIISASGEESPKPGLSTHPNSPSEKKKISPSSPNNGKLPLKQKTVSPSHGVDDWRKQNALTFALERLESWIYTKVVESIWWQVLTPQMQQPVKQDFSEADETFIDMRVEDRRRARQPVIPVLEEARQGSFSVEIWRRAFHDTYERLCPVRSLHVECGCLPMLSRLVLEACVYRLDVAMFNAILRDDEVPTDPVSDPISDLRVLPIPNSSLSFGLGAQLKNAVANLSSYISDLTRTDSNNSTVNDSFEDEENNFISFPWLKAMGGLLMLPKKMLIDKSMRKEVCPTLELPFIAKILSKFRPDEYSPEPVTQELLDIINEEVVAGNEAQEDTDDGVTVLRMASSPAVIYTPPASNMVRQWIGDIVSIPKRLAKSNSILRKGHTSDDEIDELESPISWLFNNTMGSSGYGHGMNVDEATSRNGSGNCRFMLLREVWRSS
ncbi:hypothetical protein KP509_17G008100 [Ceratopteris richardii]|uniref:C2 NT-type domain-containing protein n=1 Tax=Ceratopteris richardii TaxID=49495 RepID=A0A8T2SU82_CERRI|nr:hypothetical protein KP509_17G008100 [Ceratopteris richardii]